MPIADRHKLTTIAENFFPHDEPGCSILIVHGDETLTIQRGLAVMDSAVSIAPETNFRLASVSKQFTAACILQLRDTGTLRLDQYLKDFFPDFPDYGRSITVEHLLRHTSGIKDYEPLVEAYDFAEPVMDRDVRRILMDQEGGDFRPGSRFRYSNSGYALLAEIIEQVTGLSFPDYLRRYIFDPLGMTNSLALVNRPGAPVVPDRAIGYAINPDGTFRWSDQGKTSAVLGDGGIYTSAVDYEKWIRAYINGEILDVDTVREAWKSTVTITGDVVPYGYGWRLEQVNDKWRPYHPGSTTGFGNGVVVDPEKERVVLVLTNRSSGDSVAVAKALEAGVGSDT